MPTHAHRSQVLVWLILAFCLSAVLGRAHIERAFLYQQVSFVETRATLLARPWAVDDLDAVLARFSQQQYKKAILFCDNAGSDVVLGTQCIC